MQCGHETIRCVSCDTTYPVIAGIPVMCPDLEAYLESRHSVGLQMMRLCKTSDARDIIQDAMPALPSDGRGALERRWAAIYASSPSNLYRRICEMLPSSALGSILEHGCSVGHLSGELCGRGSLVGVDASFPALVMARRRHPDGLYVLGDSAINLLHSRFDTVVAMNMLEIVEPGTLLDMMATQTYRYMVVADPYDYSRGSRTVEKPLYARSLRKRVESLGFGIVAETASESYLDWTLRIGPRTTVQYMVDVVIAEKV